MTTGVPGPPGCGQPTIGSAATLAVGKRQPAKAATTNNLEVCSTVAPLASRRPLKLPTSCRPRRPPLASQCPRCLDDRVRHTPVEPDIPDEVSGIGNSRSGHPPVRCGVGKILRERALPFVESCEAQR